MITIISNFQILLIHECEKVLPGDTLHEHNIKQRSTPSNHIKSFLSQFVIENNISKVNYDTESISKSSEKFGFRQTSRNIPKIPNISNFSNKFNSFSFILDRRKRNVFDTKKENPIIKNSVQKTDKKDLKYETYNSSLFNNVSESNVYRSERNETGLNPFSVKNNESYSLIIENSDKSHNHSIDFTPPLNQTSIKSDQLITKQLNESRRNKVTAMKLIDSSKILKNELPDGVEGRLNSTVAVPTVAKYQTMYCEEPQFIVYTWVLCLMILGSFLKLKYLVKALVVVVMVTLHVLLLFTASDASDFIE